MKAHCPTRIRGVMCSLRLASIQLIGSILFPGVFLWQISTVSNPSPMPQTDLYTCNGGGHESVLLIIFIVGNPMRHIWAKPIVHSSCKKCWLCWWKYTVNAVTFVRIRKRTFSECLCENLLISSPRCRISPVHISLHHHVGVWLKVHPGGNDNVDSVK